jgi:hypothetical protein
MAPFRFETLLQCCASLFWALVALAAAFIGGVDEIGFTLLAVAAGGGVLTFAFVPADRRKVAGAPVAPDGVTRDSPRATLRREMLTQGVLAPFMGLLLIVEPESGPFIGALMLVFALDQLVRYRWLGRFETECGRRIYRRRSFLRPRRFVHVVEDTAPAQRNLAHAQSEAP